MPRVYGGSPGKPRSRPGSQCGKSAFVYSRRIGYPETVVNSACLSGLFSKVGCRVFFSQACSLEDGSRCTEEDSIGGAACVVTFDSSLMLIAPGRQEWSGWVWSSRSRKRNGTQESRARYQHGEGRSRLGTGAA